MITGLDRLNVQGPTDAAAELLRCCGSRRWAERLAGRRPFADEKDVARQAEAVFDTLEASDWLEAFKAHPRIGERAATEAAAGAASAAWSGEEQRGVEAAEASVLSELEQANRDYEARFGHIFIVCATGKAAPEMLDLLRARAGNEPASELRIAAAEQRKITHLRLRKLLFP